MNLLSLQLLKSLRSLAVKANNHPGVIGRIGRALDGEVGLDYLFERAFHEQSYIAALSRSLPPSKEFKISVIIPSYGIPLVYIKELFRSIDRQSYANWELCICDDADPTPGVLAYLKAQVRRQPHRVKLICHQKNQGISAATRSALRLAAGDLIAFVDADDLLHRRCFELVSRSFSSDDEIDFVYTDHDMCTDLGFRVAPQRKPGWSPELLLNANYINHLSVVRRACLDRCGAVFEDQVGGSQDWDFCLRLLQHARRVKHIPIPLYHWRRRPGSVAATVTAKPWAFRVAAQVRQAHVENLSTAVTIAPHRVDPLRGEVTLRATSSHEGVEPILLVRWGKGPHKRRQSFTFHGRVEILDMPTTDLPTLRAAVATIRSVATAKSCHFIILEHRALPALSGPLEGLLSYGLLPKVGGVWPFNNDGRRLVYTINAQRWLTPLSRDRGTFSRCTGNVLTGPGHGFAIHRDKFERALASLESNSSRTLNRIFCGHTLASFVGLACLTIGMRNVAAKSVQCRKTAKIPSIKLPLDLMPEVDPYL